MLLFLFLNKLYDNFFRINNRSNMIPAISPTMAPSKAVLPAVYKDAPVFTTTYVPTKITVTRTICSITCPYATGSILPSAWKEPFSSAKRGINNTTNDPVRKSWASSLSPIHCAKTSAPANNNVKLTIDITLK